MKDDKLYLIHIAESIDKIESYMAGLDFSAFMEKTMVQDAVLCSCEQTDCCWRNDCHGWVG
ncbi:MAG: hypothetical protein A2521_07875 [Deltaproteobacteria bacterium RIFOXYD12_FULL_57_12]|nr:MAG: hypothetical protein A2521_07875 [Deltaproteobacteria bacterium RIFOXYD12_FULL_57_12]